MRRAHASSVRRGGGPAHEDAPPARGVAGDGALVGSLDRERLDLGVSVVLLVVRQDRALHQRLQRPLGLPPVADERDPDGVGPALDLGADLEVGRRLADVALPLGVARLGRRPSVRGRRARGLAPHREPLEEPPVEAEVEQVPPPHAADVVLPIRGQPDAEDVAAVGGKMVGGGEAAARPEGQGLALPVGLRQQHRVLEAREVRRGHHAGGEARYLPRRRQVPLELRGRDGEHLGVVVEPGVRRLVPGQQRLDVDLEREEVADGVAVLGAVQAVHRAGPPGVGVRGGRLVDTRRQPRGGRARLVPAGPRQAGRRHRAGPEPRDHALPPLGVGARPIHVRRVEREPRLPELGVEHRPGPARRGDPALVVAAYAIPVQEAADRLRRGRRRLSGRGSQDLAGRAAGSPTPRRRHGNRHGCHHGRHGSGPQYLHGHPRGPAVPSQARNAAPPTAPTSGRGRSLTAAAPVRPDTMNPIAGGQGMALRVTALQWSAWTPAPGTDTPAARTCSRPPGRRWRPCRDRAPRTPAPRGCPAASTRPLRRG